nr:phage tail tape measure protein [Escherichia coli]
MATLRELIIKISANSQSFQSEIQRASRMGSEYYRTLQNGGRQAAAVSGEKMEMCNGRSAYKHGYSYPESTKNFIKDKKYPYGNW